MIAFPGFDIELRRLADFPLDHRGSTIDDSFTISRGVLDCFADPNWKDHSPHHEFGGIKNMAILTT